MKGLVIAGPTGVGKTALSIELAKELNAVIISADSMQIYKDMDIGTAKITYEEMEGIPHYMLDICEPVYNYSVGEYQRDVNKLLEKFEKEKRFVILAGGTGLYIKSITEGLAKLPESNNEIRNEFAKRPVEELFEELKEKDPESAEQIHYNNKVRIERALEVFYLTGEKFSKLSKMNIKENNYEFIKVGLERDRKKLYERIDKRVDIMFKDGLLEEAKKIYEKYNDSLEKIQAIGYKELFQYFRGEITLEEALELIKRESRRYAKRQFTWFRRDKKINWLNLDEIDEKSAKEKILGMLR